MWLFCNKNAGLWNHASPAYFALKSAIWKVRKNVASAWICRLWLIMRWIMRLHNHVFLEGLSCHLPFPLCLLCLHNWNNDTSQCNTVLQRNRNKNQKQSLKLFQINIPLSTLNHWINIELWCWFYIILHPFLILKPRWNPFHRSTEFQLSEILKQMLKFQLNLGSTWFQWNLNRY